MIANAINLWQRKSAGKFLRNMPMPKWSKNTPTEEGWYWMKYRGKRGMVLCPAQVFHLGEATLVQSARNDTFVEGPNHGGPGLKYGGKLDKSIRFGEKIKEPE